MDLPEGLCHRHFPTVYLHNEVLSCIQAIPSSAGFRPSLYQSSNCVESQEGGQRTYPWSKPSVARMATSTWRALKADWWQGQLCQLGFRHTALPPRNLQSFWDRCCPA